MSVLMTFSKLSFRKQIENSPVCCETYAQSLTAEVLEETFRDSDVLGRLGGDEFAVLAVEASGHSEATIKTRLFKCLKAISAEPSRYEISLSVGLARFDPCSRTSIGELMSKADQAMYEQKRRQSRPPLETETSTESQQTLWILEKHRR